MSEGDFDAPRRATPIEEVAECGSTMVLAATAFAAGRPVPFAVRALQQGAGRGTGGRAWASPVGNVYLTLVTPAPPLALLPVFPLVLGLAVLDGVRAEVGARLATAEAGEAQRQQRRFRLKWPNDVLCDGAKVSGALVEMLSRDGATALSCGIGVNVAVAPPVTDGGRASARVQDAAPDATAAGVAAGICAALDARLRWAAMAEVPRVRIVRAYEAELDLTQPVFRRLPPSEAASSGAGRDPTPLRPLGLDEWGHLRVARPDGTQETLSADYLF
jgi:BirA family biotin operon repressor/biotin-[acetyl-CoA-carboxylase] ligase